MSQSYFSKLDPKEKESRLMLLGSSGGDLTIWIKGQKDKIKAKTQEYSRDRNEIVLAGNANLFPAGTNLLCSFDLRGMTFFAQVVLQRSVRDLNVLHFTTDLFKSERRASYRLLTYPIYEVYAEFDLKEAYEGGKVVDLKTKTSQTALFKNFLKLIENKDEHDNHQTIKYRVQDLSATGMALHVGDLEAQFFAKGMTYKDVRIKFTDETIIVPDVQVVYLVDYLAGDKNLKKYKVGLHFENLPTNIDQLLGQKINQLLRDNDFNKDFEDFLK